MRAPSRTALRRRPRSNPSPWVAKAVAENLDQLQTLPAEWMPILLDAQAKGEFLEVDLDELGCGAYGCVLATRDPDVVMKITTDSTEAEFVELAMPWGWPGGITSYFGIQPLEGHYQVTRQVEKSPAWALWRQAARLVGKIDLLEKIELKTGPHDRPRIEVETEAGYRHRLESMVLLDAIYLAGRKVHAIFQGLRGDKMRLWAAAIRQRDYALDAVARAGTPGSLVWRMAIIDEAVALDLPPRVSRDIELEVQVALALTGYQQASVAMLENPVVRSIGEALLFYLEKRLVLADLHTGNFGLVIDERDAAAGERWAITDPGHVLALPSPWAEH